LLVLVKGSGVVCVPSLARHCVHETDAAVALNFVACVSPHSAGAAPLAL